MKIKEYLRLGAILYCVFFILTGIFILADGLFQFPSNNKFIFFLISFALIFHGIVVAVIIFALKDLLIKQEIISDYIIDNINKEKVTHKPDNPHLFRN
jgi:hypothetical protein